MRKILLISFALVASLLCSLSADAIEAYACYTPNDSTLMFYCDNQRSSRTGTTYDLNTGDDYPDWYTGGTYRSVTMAVFDPSFADARPTSTNGWFKEMYKLLSITGLEHLNTRNVTNMRLMFSGCSGLTSLDLSGFDTGNVTDMGYMFYDCSGLTSLDLSSFNTGNVTDMGHMFYDCSGLTSLDLSSFDTGNVTDMGHMFYDCRGLTSLDLSGFDTGNVTDMSRMFNRCSGLTSLDLSGFDTGNVANMKYLFDSCSGLTSLDLSSFDTGNVTDMGSMFIRCSGLTSLDLSSFDTGNVTNMIAMFQGCSNLTTIYAGSGWSTEMVTNSSSMFSRCTSLVGGQGSTYRVNCADATYAHIDGGPSNPGYLTDPNVLVAYAKYDSNTTTLSFYYDNKLSPRMGATYLLNTASASPRWFTDGTYANVTQVVFDPSFAEARPISTHSWFRMMYNLVSITGMEYLNTVNVTDMRGMFDGCSGLTGLNVSGFNTENVVNISYMFANCSGLTSLDVSGFDTGNVTYMYGVFWGCSGLTSLDVSGFDTGNVTYMYGMFWGCSGLNTIFAGSGWSTAAVTESADMFTDCTSLVGGMGTTYDANHVDAAYAHIDGGPSDPGYFTAVPEYLPGDANGDGVVNIADVTDIIDCLLRGGDSSFNAVAADVNFDGTVSIADVTDIIDYLLKGTW